MEYEATVRSQELTDGGDARSQGFEIRFQARPPVVEGVSQRAHDASGSRAPPARDHLVPFSRQKRRIEVRERHRRASALRQGAKREQVVARYQSGARVAAPEHG
jgi:hypothetical protein